jgi:hypothetical protein
MAAVRAMSQPFQVIGGPGHVAVGDGPVDALAGVAEQVHVAAEPHQEVGQLAVVGQVAERLDFVWDGVTNWSHATA